MRVLTALRRAAALPHARGFASATSADDAVNFAHCASLVRSHDYSGYLCTAALPVQQRQAAFAVRAFNVETAQAIDAAKEPKLAAMRLTWWRDTLSRALSDEGKPPPHPVARALRAVAGSPEQSATVRKLLDRVITSRIADTETLGLPPSIEAMEVYAQGTAGSVLEAILVLQGAATTEARLTAADVGRAVGLSALLAGARVHASRNRYYLPADVAKKAGLRADTLRKGGGGQPLRDTARAVAEAAEAHLRSARERRGSLPAGCSGVFLPAVPAEIFLRALRKAQFDVFADDLARVSGVVSPTRLQMEIGWAAFRGRY